MPSAPGQGRIEGDAPFLPGGEVRAAVPDDDHGHVVSGGAKAPGDSKEFS